jgi:hypothetical protein
MTIAAIGIATQHASAQFGYGARGSGEMQANGILGSGGLRGASILGSGGGLAGAGSGMYRDAFRPEPFRDTGANSQVGGTTKPFSNYSPQSSAVSPYLNLFRTDLGSVGGLNYTTLVQPQLQQQQFNSQTQGKTALTNQRITALAAKPQFNPLGDKNLAPTGHQTYFNNLGGNFGNHDHYFQAPQRHQKPKSH